jgi:DNA-binding transcriptional LysR family regulator
MPDQIPDFSDLDKFAQVVACGSFVRAAAQLGVSQPALSKCIARIERNLGVRILERHARGVVPSPYGQALLNGLRPALADLRSALQDIESMKGGHGGTVVIGASPSVATYFLPQLVARLHQHAQGIRLKVNEGLAEGLLEDLRQNRIDLAITSKPSPEPPQDMESQNLFKDRFVVCCSTQHPLARKRKIEPEELQHYPWVLAPRGGLQHKEFERSFRKLSVAAPSAMVETSSAALSKKLVMTQGFLSLLPLELIAYEELKSDIVQLPVPWLEWERHVCLLRRRDKVHSGAESLAHQQILSLAKKLGRLGG